MTTFAPNQDENRPSRELSERTQRAWSAYRDSLRDLTGRDYEETERRAWDRLQRKLQEAEAQTAETGATPRRRREDH